MFCRRVYQEWLLAAHAEKLRRALADTAGGDIDGEDTAGGETNSEDNAGGDTYGEDAVREQAPENTAGEEHPEDNTAEADTADNTAGENTAENTAGEEHPEEAISSVSAVSALRVLRDWAIAGSETRLLRVRRAAALDATGEAERAAQVH